MARRIGGCFIRCISSKRRAVIHMNNGRREAETRSAVGLSTSWHMANSRQSGFGSMGERALKRWWTKSRHTDAMPEGQPLPAHQCSASLVAVDLKVFTRGTGEVAAPIHARFGQAVNVYLRFEAVR